MKKEYKSKKIIIILGIIMALLIIPFSNPQEEIDLGCSRTGSTQTCCRLVNDRKVCSIELYSGTRFGKNATGDYVDPSKLFRITKSSDDLTFHYSGIEGDFGVTFETGAFYNNNYYSMYNIKQLKPQIQFNFPIKTFPANKKYAVNITNIPIDLQTGLENITLTYKDHYGFTLQDLKSTKGRYLIKNIMSLVFDDLKESGFLININKSEKRIYISNLTENIFDNSLYLDPTIQLQDADAENMEDTFSWEDYPDTCAGAQQNLEIGEDYGCMEGWIKFNITAIPSGQQIDNSDLWLYTRVNTFLGGDTPNMTIYELNNHDWIETTECTWNTRPLTDIGSILDYDDTIGNTASVWINFSVTSWVSSEYNNGDKNVSFYLNETLYNCATGKRFEFPSKEYAVDTTIRPYLNITYSSAADTTLPVPKQESPADNNYTDDVYNPTINFNMSAIDETGLSHIELWTNTTGTWSKNSTCDISELALTWDSCKWSLILANGTYIWGGRANDTTGNVNWTETNYTIRVNSTAPDIIAPAVTLNLPADDATLTATGVTFNCSATDATGLDNITLWHNHSGSWTEIETKNLSGISNSTTFSKTLTEKYNIDWNCYACDNLSSANCGFATANFTFSIEPLRTFNISIEDYGMEWIKFSFIPNTFSYNSTIVGNLNITRNLEIMGCIKYNCSQSGGCVTLGTCL